MDDGSSKRGASRMIPRRLPIGAELRPEGVHFRVWAPATDGLAVELEGQPPHPLTAEAGGYFSGFIVGVKAGARYLLRLAGHDRGLPDPASRFQPDGPHGSSEVIDPAAFPWTDGPWQGVPRERLVIYEMHIGTFTPEGTWTAATRELAALVELGVTCIEMMPIADFPGRFGWGYDGVDMFAPTHLYGRPDDLRRFVDRAHALGLAVILDVVYNHLGPDGNYLTAFSPAYFTGRHGTEWGEALNFDGWDCEPVREFFTANAGYWIEEYHFDGLRLDATHQIFDSSPEHVLAAIGRRVREAAPGRSTFIAAENDAQLARLARAPEAGGYGLDALWNDDFHHAGMVALTGRREGYYRPFHGTAREFVALAKHGFLFQGQDCRKRGTFALDLQPFSFVTYLQNHDQIAHSGRGERAHRLASPGCWRAMTAYLLLSPGIPLLFQGQEFEASSPFLYFADHQGELRRLIPRGRAEFLKQFPSLASPAMQAALADPGDPETFRRCVLDLSERERNQKMRALHRDLIALRHKLLGDRSPRIDGATLGDSAWLLRYFRAGGEDALLIVNLGCDQRLDTIAEPLLASRDGETWRCLWSSEDPRYGGTDIPPPMVDGSWNIPGHAAVVLGF